MLQNVPGDLDLYVTLLGKELHLVPSANDLGAHVGATLSFDDHKKYFIFLFVEFMSN